MLGELETDLARGVPPSMRESGDPAELPVGRSQTAFVEIYDDRTVVAKHLVALVVRHEGVHDP